MSKTTGGGSRQRELFGRSKQTTITVEHHHPMVVLTDTMDWTGMEVVAQGIRARKLKNSAGRPPHLRAMLGALTLMALRRLPYREVEEQIRYYAPARYLCGLTETDWTPDFTTIQDFAQLLGEDGVKEINEGVVKLAVELGMADPAVVVADTTAQEAGIPHPNEMGLLQSFVSSLQTAGQKAGQAIKGFVAGAGEKLKAVKERVRRYRLFAKTTEAKKRVLTETAKLVAGLNAGLGKALFVAAAEGRKLRGVGIVAQRKLVKLHETMDRLLPQIHHWLRTGYVAAGKIINLHIPELYAVVRGKVGKAVEFGLQWGITRLCGGFVLATLGRERDEVHDSAFAVRAAQDIKALFGEAPRAYAYDRGGYSAANVRALRNLGVKDVGLAPRGQAQWAVKGRVKEDMIRERGLVEASIGTIKSGKYNFNRPAARSVAMMGVCGQRAVMGANLTKLVRGVAKKRGIVLAA